MARADYYGGRKSVTTCLELYSLAADSRERSTHRLLTDQDAYDSWHLALYLKEILSYRRLLNEPSLSLEQLPRPEKNLLLYLILAAGPQFQTVLELGSSLFEMIDGLELTREFMRRAQPSVPVRSPKSLSYHGVEISELLSQGSRALHPGYRVTLYPDVAAFQGRCDVLYDRNVSSYAFETAEELAEFVNRAEVALMNLAVSKGRSFVCSRLGKAYTYFSLAELANCLRRPLFHLFGERFPRPFAQTEPDFPEPVIEGFFLAAAPEFTSEFMAMAARTPQVKSYFETKNIVPREVHAVLAS